MPHYAHELARLSNRHVLAEWTYYKFPYLFPLRAFPPVIELEITNECNFSCPHCPRTVFNKTNGLGLMSLELFQKIAEQSAGRVSLIKFCGLGEPALHPQLDAMARLLQRDGIPLSLYTNGTLFDRHLPREILEWDLHNLVISVDGIDERSFKRLRVGGDYRHLRTMVAEFRKAREKARKRSPQIEIRHVIMPYETPAMLKKFRDDWTDGLGDTVKFNLLESPCSQGTIDPARPRCRDIRRELYVRHNGRVPLCGFHVDWIGDAHTSTIEEIWHCSRLEDVRRQHARRNLSELPFCKTCSFR